MAEEIIDSKKAKRQLEKLITLSNKVGLWYLIK
jgi:hypothetical protein